VEGRKTAGLSEVWRSEPALCQRWFFASTRLNDLCFVVSYAHCQQYDQQYDMLRSFREFLQWRKGDAIILAEANVLPENDMEYFGRDGDRMHMMFNFHVNQHLFYALASADTKPLAKSLERPNRGQLLRNGACFCAITTNWTSAG
jgi:hypothetical protein